MRNAFKLGLIAVLATAALPGAAQNSSANPNYQTITLNSGFTPDPNVINLQAGGSIAASSAAGGCQGFITNAPDVRLHYNAGSLPLIISVASGSDTTLVINAPDGSWYCDDDGGNNGSNPAVRFNSPRSGRYEIWIGTYSAGSLQSAQLHISEIYSQ